MRSQPHDCCISMAGCVHHQPEKENMTQKSLTALALVMTAACGTPADSVSAYLAALPGWDAFSPQSKSAELTVGDGTTETVLFDGKTHFCTTTKRSLTANPDQIVIYQPDRNVLWPGALLQGKGYVGGVGSLLELPVRQRAPVTVFIDLLGPDVTEVVENPDAASLQSAIGRLVAKAKDQRVPPQLRASFSTTSFDHTTQASLQLGMSAKFFGKASVNAQLNRTRDSTENAVMADLKASAFTVTVVAPQTPSAVFRADFTKARLDEQIALGNIGPDNIPVYVSSVTYGKRFLYNTVSKSTTVDVLASLNASMDWKILSGSASLQSHYRDVLNKSQIGIVAIGGSEEQLRSASNSERGLKAYFETDTRIDEWVPISYEVRNLGDGSIATMSETTTYNQRDCQLGDGKVHKVELQLVDVYNDARATVERSGALLLNIVGNSERIDITNQLSGTDERLVIGNGGDRPCWLCRWQRHVTANVWVDSKLVKQENSNCKGCNSEARAIVFGIDKTTGHVTVTEKR